MMTPDDIGLLDTPAVREAVSQRLGDDPARIALERRLPHAALVATQVKYLQRAAAKLPSYRAAECIIPPRAFEQASSEACAAHKEFGGGVCVDLTCGLGVDSLMLARGFRRVVSVERDEALAAAARINFRRLGADNIEVVCAAAEDFAASLAENSADMVYVDPDRRDAAGRRRVRLEECSPDVAGLMEGLLRAAPRVVVKCSPLFDVDEAFRLFSPLGGVRVEAVSWEGECREVVVEVSRGGRERRLGAWVVGRGGVEYSAADEFVAAGVPDDFAARLEGGCYDRAVLADAALRKARIGRRYVGDRYEGACASSEGGFVFVPAGAVARSEEPLLGRIFEIRRAERYNPRRVRRALREWGITCATLMRHDFPLSAAEVLKALGLCEGAGPLLAVTAAGGERWLLELEQEKKMEI